MNRILSFYETELSTNDHTTIPAPKSITIHSLYPNPTNTSFTIDYTTSSPDGSATISILNIKGQLILETIQKNLSESRQSWTWNGLDQKGLNVPTGIYLVQVRNQHHIATQKVTLLK